jgi:hypothetical protein
MTQVSKYLFDMDFDDPEGKRAHRIQEEPEAEIPTFSEDDIVAAREHGYEAGIAAGKAQATASTERRIEELLSNTTEQFNALNAIVEGERTLVGTDIATLAGAIAGKLLGQQTNDERMDLIASLVQDSLARLYQAPEVTMLVGVDLVEGLRSRFAASELTITVNIVGEQGLTGTDFRLSWNGGGSERIESEIWRDVEKILERRINASELKMDTKLDAMPESDATPDDVEQPIRPAGETLDQSEDTADATDNSQSTSGADDTPPHQE